MTCCIIELVRAYARAHTYRWKVEGLGFEAEFVLRLMPTAAPSFSTAAPTPVVTTLPDFTLDCPGAGLCLHARACVHPCAHVHFHLRECVYQCASWSTHIWQQLDSAPALCCRYQKGLCFERRLFEKKQPQPHITIIFTQYQRACGL